MSENLSPIGFWSYARQDDEEKLSGLRSILQRQLQQKYGREPIKIFQDVAAIPPGADWNLKISEALHSSTFLIPIITPNFLESEWCNQEVFVFLEQEQAIAAQFPELAASRRIYPIFYIDITDVEAFDPRLLAELRKRQWTNFRDLIYKDEKHESVRLRLDQIAESIVRVLRLDQRAARERKIAAAAVQALELQAEEEAAAERKKGQQEAARITEEARQKEQQELAAQRARDEAARQAREDAERKAREAEEKRQQDVAHREAQERAFQRARESEAQARLEFEEAARNAHEEEQRRSQAQQSVSSFVSQIDSQPEPTPFWKTPVAIIAGVLIAIVAIMFLLFRYGSDAPQPSVGQQASNPVTAPSASAYDQAKADAAKGDYADAAPLLNQACQSGTPEACVDLGNLYRMGRGVTADVSKAGQLFQQGCKAGDQNGCTQYNQLQAALAALNGG